MKNAKSIVLVITSAIFFLYSCAQSNKKKNNITKENISSLDTSKFTVIKYNPTEHNWVFKTGAPTILSDGEILEAEKILKAKINEYNIEKKEWFEKKFKDHPNENAKLENYTINGLENYYKQFVAIINEKGEKEIWINCFCHLWDGNDWRKDILGVDDGGKCYFEIKLNLSTKTVYRFMVNGNA